ncbi:bacillithiol biosynthesis cysteine-adding enzyme BshC [Alkalihalobacillus pseudalcaliphilus]|uniref:bacillithiol biosynthesis cysteine-adding enzyme BshC n=1 Tax=Alkalihalobacillus pseudalcaliphilus TaxID=79884 RepID=UPI00064DCB33|nr:bacillithiol biosynthesis cysteine-adding enzyme BshC [Alkalihalobacillus pseudalcaliphilus]KMK77109.1 hypothetical protein AB990_06040 [Alkalihalobacillus pseudalcaliphilus]
MEVKDISHSNEAGFLKDYIEGEPKVKSFFHYGIDEQNKYQKRLEDIRARSYNREALVSSLRQFHERLNLSPQSLERIHTLVRDDAVVIVGGQQAGLLTGPMYTFYKALTTVKLAKEQEQKLGVPVVPVFWIAGEDHDLDEIRYVFSQEKHTWKKVLLDIDESMQSASNVTLDHGGLDKWLTRIFSQLPETEYTKDLTKIVHQFSLESQTLVDFFAKLLDWLFADEGLVLLDAHQDPIRNMEKVFFECLIDQVDELQFAQQEGARQFEEAGYGRPIMTEKENAHLFMEFEGKRVRLDYVEGNFYLKDLDHSFTRDELLDLLNKQPSLFSNNVVTRPLMQEYILPVLAFISGPGEIKYWATLKRSFELFDLKMPPVIPRLMMTIVPKMTENWLQEKSYTVEDFLNGGGQELRRKWIDESEKRPVSLTVDEVKRSISQKHAPLRELAQELDYSLGKLAEKNLQLINQEIEFVEKRMLNHLQKKHEQELSKFDEANRWLYPLNRPQERVIHPFILLNLVGKSGLCRMMELEIPIDSQHKLIFL